jgi:hypothetical protein
MSVPGKFPVTHINPDTGLVLNSVCLCIRGNTYNKTVNACHPGEKHPSLLKVLIEYSLKKYCDSCPDTK